MLGFVCTSVIFSTGYKYILSYVLWNGKKQRKLLSPKCSFEINNDEKISTFWYVFHYS